MPIKAIKFLARDKYNFSCKILEKAGSQFNCAAFKLYANMPL